MKTFKEYSQVKVAKLLESNRSFTGSENVSRPPQIGDVGTVVHIYESNKAYVVEMGNSDGYTVWLADFAPEELENV